MYHEMMTNVPLLDHGHAPQAAILSGGAGAMLREVTREKKLAHSTMA
ncbi:spermine/spermidine synthase domain-containing protein [Escherichia coli]